MTLKNGIFRYFFFFIFLAFSGSTFSQFPGGYGTGIRFWLKGNAGTFSNAGTTASTNNTALQQWNDQSGNANHATQILGLFKPTYLSSVSNGNPGARFDGTDYIDATASTAISGTADYSAFFVVKLTTSTPGTATDGSGSFILDRTTASNDLFSLKVVASGGTNRFLYQKRNAIGGNLGGPSSTSVVDNSNFQIIMMSRTYNSGGNTISRIYVNGLQEATTSNASETTVPPVMRIGRHATDLTAGMTGDLTEMIVYSNEPTVANRQQIESYLALKYGISLDQSTVRDYFASDGTVIYPATSTHSTYLNTITGIGMDNGSLLAQTDSKNQNANDFVRVFNPSAMTTGEFLLWGNNNGTMLTPNSTDVGGGINRRLTRVWKIAQTGNVGTVDISVDLSSVPGAKSQTYLRLLVDRDGDGFADNDVTPLTGTLVGNIFTVSGVTLQHGDLFTVGSTNSALTPLPVRLSDFEVSCDMNKPLIKWETMMEENTENFEIERATDAAAFETIGVVAAAGLSFTKKEYSFVDQRPLSGLSYYRLKQNDKDGTSTRYPLAAIDCSNDPGVSVYPNPTSGLFFIESGRGTGRWRLRNTVGKSLMEIDALENITQIDLNSFEPGIYYLESVDQKPARVLKIVFSQ